MTDTTANATDEMVSVPREPTPEMVDAMNDVAIDGPGYVSFYPSLQDCKRLYATALSAAPSSPVTGGVVKAIEWGKTSYGRPEAYTAVGVYRINEAMNGGWSVTSKNDVLRDTDGRSNFPTIEAAKAAAQQHYTKAIFSCLNSEGRS